MKFYNQVLSKFFEITQCNGGDIRVIVSEKFRFPSIDEDIGGPVLRVPKPVKAREGLVLNGIIFQNNDLGRSLLMRMAMSSVEHLSVHTIITDFSLYNNWLRGRDTKLAVFVVDLIEDLCVNSYMKSSLKGLLRDIAVSNAVSYNIITNPQTINSENILIQSALLSYLIAGRSRYLLPPAIKKDLFQILYRLQLFEKLILQKYGQSLADGTSLSKEFTGIKIELADYIYTTLAKYGPLKKILYLPFTDSHEGIGRINEELVFDMDESAEVLADTYRCLGLSPDHDNSHQETLAGLFSEEASNILYDIAVERNWKERLVNSYLNLSKNTEFDDIIFPEEDYAEYYRAYRKHVGSIRKVLDQIRVVKNNIDENPNQEIGQIDVNEAIQVLAAKRANNNIFLRDEYMSKNEAWCLLLDMSSSLKPFFSTTKDMALCLAEVAKDLIPGKQSWGLYGFSNKFTVIKDIGEDYSANAKARIGGLGHGGLSYIPTALELGARAVASAGKDNNFIFLISDGKSTGYPDIESKMEKTIKRIQNTGTTIVSVGVGSHGLKSYLRNTSLVAETPPDLMNKLAKSYFQFSAP